MNFYFLLLCLFLSPVQAFTESPIPFSARVSSRCLSSFIGINNPVYNYIYHNPFESLDSYKFVPDINFKDMSPPKFIHFYHNPFESSDSYKFAPDINFKDMSPQKFIDFFQIMKREVKREYASIRKDEYKNLDDIFNGIYKITVGLEMGYELFELMPFLLERLDSKVVYTKKSRRETLQIVNDIYDLLRDEEIWKKLDLIYKKTASKSQISKNDKTFIRNVIYSFSNGYSTKVKKLYGNVHKKIIDFNILKRNQTERNSFYVKNKDRLDGLNELWIDTARKEALRRNRGKEKGYFINVNTRNLSPLIYAHNRDFRQKFYKHYYERFYEQIKMTEDILNKTQEIARSQGFAKCSGYCFSDNHGLAGSPKGIMNLFEQLIHAIKDQAQKDISALEAKAKDLHNIRKLEPWDINYYHNYFQNNLKIRIHSSSVIDVTFKHFEKLLNLQFKEKKKDEFPFYKEDIKVYDVYHEGEYKGILIMDLFSITEKEYAVNADLSLYPDNGLSIAIIKTHFKKGRDYLDARDIETLFHEMGHAAQIYINPNSDIASSEQSLDQLEFYSVLQETLVSTSDVLNLFTKKDVQTNFSSHLFMSESKERPFSVKLLERAYVNLLLASLYSQGEIKNLENFEKDLINKLDLSPFLQKFLLSQNILLSYLVFGYQDPLERRVNPDSMFDVLTRNGYFYTELLTVYFLNQYTNKQKGIYNPDLKKQLLSLYKKKTFKLKDLKYSKKGTIRNRDLIREFVDYYFK